mmetsp:Transcript_30727/g.74190  ORF Transcript_30727/g.74190 Transcript_30727/m.74190 type:complete len:106 (+) Transcript_30727:156-473(+)
MSFSLDTLQNIMRSHFILSGRTSLLFHLRCTGSNATRTSFRRSLSFGSALFLCRSATAKGVLLAIQTNKLVQDSQNSSIDRAPPTPTSEGSNQSFRETKLTALFC